ncbi:MAG TPA: ligase-associated DNA damage response endonuclease PdeM [Gemmatimonadales bacterium]|jgi:DNA ligase-associated metallophosphoesterase|nr:ligase-associated DNA damage response endonuclease PdeM [Gemmatimonadales bacterium]
MTDVMLTIAGEQIYLLSERALYWPGASTLVVADLHWGKAATFRSVGIPIPIGTTSDDLARLDSALARTHARRMVVLGDLFHAKAGRIASHTLAELRRWRNLAGNFEILLVRGNHDRHAGDPPGDLHINCVNAPAYVPPFVFRHEPADSTGAYGLAGHVHPGLTLVGRGLQRETLPCFIIGRTAALIPAFGSFTGFGVVEPGPEDRAFVIAGDEVLEVSAPVDLDPTALPTRLQAMSQPDPI